MLFCRKTTNKDKPSQKKISFISVTGPPLGEAAPPAGAGVWGLAPTEGKRSAARVRRKDLSSTATWNWSKPFGGRELRSLPY